MSDRESANKATTAESLCTGSQTKVGEICLDPDKTAHCGNSIQREKLSEFVFCTRYLLQSIFMTI